MTGPEHSSGEALNLGQSPDEAEENHTSDEALNEELESENLDKEPEEVLETPDEAQGGPSLLVKIGVSGRSGRLSKEIEKVKRSQDKSEKVEEKQSPPLMNFLLRKKMMMMSWTGVKLTRRIRNLVPLTLLKREKAKQRHTI